MTTSRRRPGGKDPETARKAGKTCPVFVSFLAVLCTVLAALGDWKVLNNAYGALPKAVSLLIIVCAFLSFLVAADFSNLRRAARYLPMFLLLIAVYAGISMFIWVTDFSQVSSIGRAGQKILYQTIETMLDENKSIEEIARAVSKKRNELRLEAYIGDPDGLKRVKQSNLDTYGNEEGPTIDYLYEKYGSWEAILQKALSSNPGMDACLGLYDDFYEFYGIEEKVQLKITEEAVKTDASGKKLYTVKKDDNLWKIAETIYGDGSKWNLIYEANKEILENPGDLRVGMELVIPEAPQKKGGEAAASATTAAASAATTASTAAAAQTE